jgi:flagellar protein FlaG
MQIAKNGMDAALYVPSTERLRLIKGARGGPDETKYPRYQGSETASPSNVKMNAEQVRQEQTVSPEDFIQTVEEANKRYCAYDKLLQFSVHKETRQIMIKIINTKTEEIIAEIPPEKILDMIAQLWEMAGLLVDKKV